MRRGRKSQDYAAAYLNRVFPDAVSIAASLSGKDILNTPGWALEVKGRREFLPTQWSKQMTKNELPDEYSACIMRPDGYGEAKVGEWLVFMTFKEFRDLIEELQDHRERDER